MTTTTTVNIPAPCPSECDDDIQDSPWVDGQMCAATTGLLPIANDSSSPNAQGFFFSEKRDVIRLCGAPFDWGRGPTRFSSQNTIIFQSIAQTRIRTQALALTLTQMSFSGTIQSLFSHFLFSSMKIYENTSQALAFNHTATTIR